MADLLEALDGIDPARLSYEEWLSVGMALQYEGYDCETWEEWSQRDAARFHPGECARKWDGFGESDKPVKGGTIVELAHQNGWHESTGGGGYHHQRETGDVLIFDTPEEEITKFLKTLFAPDDIVGFVTDDVKKNESGKFVPFKGTYTWTRDQLLASMKQYGAKGLFNPNPEAGAWIRINALDGEGVSNKNVVKFKYALAESDELDLARQKEVLLGSNLPIATIVQSGGRSLHALVKVDAKDFKQYRERVTYLFEYLDRHGFHTDEANKNPSRLSRFAGFDRAGKHQRLMAVNVGYKTWDEWKVYADGERLDLPPIVNYEDWKANPPKVKAPVIEGISNAQSTIMITAASKAGKTMLGLQLAFALATGGEWLGHQCTKCNALYINMEVDERETFDRMIDTENALREKKRMNVYGRGVFVWNLNGQNIDVETFKEQVIHKIDEANASVVILDPLYQLNTGDENKVQDVMATLKSFDEICRVAGVTFVYLHHHPKGDMSERKSEDRAAGSGAFARCASTIIDLCEIKEVPTEVREDMPPEMLQNEYSEARLFVISYTLRSYKTPKDCAVWYSYPLHYVDEDALDRVREASHCDKKELPVATKKQSETDKIREAFECLEQGRGKVDAGEIAGYWGVSRKTAQNWAFKGFCPEEIEYANGWFRKK